MNKNVIHQDYSITQQDRTARNQHQAKLLWFTGLSGSGKSTLANEVEKQLFAQGMQTYVLDGDNIRRGINTDLSFTPEDRKENLRRIAEASKLFIDAGVVTLAAFISPMREDREMIKQIVGEENFIEIYVDAKIEDCEHRDVKGLYQKARQGEIKNFTGISAPYEAPANPEIKVNTSNQTIEESLTIIINKVTQKLS
ncbi:adenylylsulfate kinase [Mesonia algae]|uniref:Adenylyl-sulfate kinase n=1 Tax=Mesonia algae TaxID=213248 RepID=A0A2W7IBB8_9FLAO|nr:adenylyl-sulfate kinase [Mesonia algae]PZW44206.1 adenylylsulfate kinase [Mesonia algae]